MPRRPRKGFRSSGCAYGHGAPPEGVRYLLNLLDLRVFVGRFVAVDEQELGPKQPDAVGTGLGSGRGGEWMVHVGLHGYAHSIGGSSGLLGGLAAPASAVVLLALFGAQALGDVVGRVDPDVPLGAVKGHAGAVFDVEHPVSDVEDRGDTPGA